MALQHPLPEPATLTDTQIRDRFTVEHDLARMIITVTDRNTGARIAYSDAQARSMFGSEDSFLRAAVGELLRHEHGFGRFGQYNSEYHSHTMSAPRPMHGGLRSGTSLRAVSEEDFERLVSDAQELKMLKRRFESLFKIPADKVMPPALERVPEHPEQWRIRVRVEAFEVETTVGELAAATNNPAAALTWWQKIRELPGGTHTSVVDLGSAIGRAQDEIAMRILKGKRTVSNAQDSAALDESHVLKAGKEDES